MERAVLTVKRNGKLVYRHECIEENTVQLFESARRHLWWHCQWMTIPRWQFITKRGGNPDMRAVHGDLVATFRFPKVPRL